jgi:DNA-binding transcriptional LysR family regulator
MEFLNQMALFVEVVKAKGFRGAADTIGMPNSTLCRRISALEKAIGLRLLHRTTFQSFFVAISYNLTGLCFQALPASQRAHSSPNSLTARASY